MQRVTLGEATKGKSANLQIIRFIAAIMVIISHSFALSQGTDNKEYLIILSQGQITMGGLAVSIFFLAGGYLITKSMLKYKKFKTYFKVRLLRIFPALIFVVLISAFIIGPILSTNTIKTYFSSSLTYRYLLNGILLLQHNLPGVFEKNVYVSTINGALWTIPVEFLCYIACYLCYKLGLLKKDKFYFTIPFVIFACVAVKYLSRVIPTLEAMSRPCLLFYIGIFYYIYRNKVVLNKVYAIICSILLVVCSTFGGLNFAMLLFFPYIMLTMFFGTKQYINKFSKLGDYSYGIYLWGFPVQQIVVSLNEGRMNPYWNMCWSIPVAIVLGIATYYIVEKPLIK